jgi:outer membrane murein-binding lipoprotein Lpp
MRIRDKKNQTYDRFRYLLEFQFKNQPKLDEQDEEPALDDEMGDDVFGELGGVLDGNKKPEEQGIEQPQEEQPIENKTDIDIDVSDNQGFEDTASDLLKIHASKIDKLTQYINDSVQILQVLNQKTDEITTNVDQMNGKVGELSQRVDKLTPPTPLESLNQMITTTTGAQSIEDYWNEYFAKHGRTDLVNGSLYYGNKQYNENEKGMTSGVYRSPDISDTQIKDIIKNT